MLIYGCEIKVIQGDITDLQVEAIVNAANNQLVMGGGVAAAIKRKGGVEIEKEALKKAPIQIGQAVETTAGKLSAKYIIHAATMGMDFKTDESKIRASCASSLRLAEKLGISSIAFPALGCGVGGFPLLASAKIMSQELFRFLRQDQHHLKTIIFCLYDQQTYAVFQKGVLDYLEYIIKKIQSGPFITVDVIIDLGEGIVLIERSNPPFGWALPGGFVDYGESLEEAAMREAKEETGLQIKQLKQFHTYSSPERDPRFHTVSTVFIAQAQGKPCAGDDAANLKIVKYADLYKIDYAFDHKKIIEDYIKYKEGLK